MPNTLKTSGAGEGERMNEMITWDNPAPSGQIVARGGFFPHQSPLCLIESVYDDRLMGTPAYDIWYEEANFVERIDRDTMTDILCRMFDCRVKHWRIVRYVNRSTGYPVFRIDLEKELPVTQGMEATEL